VEEAEEIEWEQDRNTVVTKIKGKAHIICNKSRHQNVVVPISCEHESPHCANVMALPVIS